MSPRDMEIPTKYTYQSVNSTKNTDNKTETHLNNTKNVAQRHKIPAKCTYQSINSTKTQKTRQKLT